IAAIEQPSTGRLDQERIGVERAVVYQQRRDREGPDRELLAIVHRLPLTWCGMARHEWRGSPRNASRRLTAEDGNAMSCRRQEAGVIGMCMADDDGDQAARV